MKVFLISFVLNFFALSLSTLNASDLKPVKLKHGIQLKIFDHWEIYGDYENKMVTASAKDKFLKSGIKTDSSIKEYEIIFTAASEVRGKASSINISVGPPEIDQSIVRSIGEEELSSYKEALTEKYTNATRVLSASNLKLHVKKLKLNEFIALKITSSFDIKNEPSAFNESYKIYLDDKTVTLNIEKRSYSGNFEIEDINKVINSLEISM